MWNRFAWWPFSLLMNDKRYIFFYFPSFLFSPLFYSIHLTLCFFCKYAWYRLRNCWNNSFRRSIALAYPIGTTRAFQMRSMKMSQKQWEYSGRKYPIFKFHYHFFLSPLTPFIEVDVHSFIKYIIHSLNRTSFEHVTHSLNASPIHWTHHSFIEHITHSLNTSSIHWTHHSFIERIVHSLNTSSIHWMHHPFTEPRVPSSATCADSTAPPSRGVCGADTPSQSGLGFASSKHSLPTFPPQMGCDTQRWWRVWTWNCTCSRMLSLPRASLFNLLVRVSSRAYSHIVFLYTMASISLTFDMTLNDRINLFLVSIKQQVIK